jgi:hypothetical protein
MPSRGVEPSPHIDQPGGFGLEVSGVAGEGDVAGLLEEFAVGSYSLSLSTYLADSGKSPMDIMLFKDLGHSVAGETP